MLPRLLLLLLRRLELGELLLQELLLQLGALGLGALLLGLPQRRGALALLARLLRQLEHVLQGGVGVGWGVGTGGRGN